VSVGAVVACCALTAACTQEPEQTRSPSPTSAATTPSESQIERQMRLDYEAAEEAYRSSTAEQDRLYQAGGATKATPSLRATATGSYLRITLKSLREVHESGWRAKGNTKDHRGCGQWRLAERSSWSHQLRGQQRHTILRPNG
jgi:hypothetical protein